MQRQKKRNIVIMLICVILIIFLTIMLYVDSKRKAEYAKQAEDANRITSQEAESERQEAESKAAAELEREQAEIRELAQKAGLDETDGDIVYENSVGFERNGGGSFSVDISQVDSIGLIIINGAANGSNCIIAADFSGNNVQYSLSVQESSIYIPIDSNDFNGSVAFSVEGSLSVDRIRVVNLNSADSKLDVKSGIWLKEATNIDIEYGSGINKNKSYACLSDGTYLYTAQADHLSIYDTSGESDVLVREVSEINSVRHMAFTGDGNYLVCTARSNGVYIIDIRTPEKAKTVTHFSSLELATGLAIDGDYLYVCSRYFGIEVWNISNPEAPIYCATIRGEKEYQNCYVSEGYLYIAIYNEAKIEIWNVEDPCNAKIITTIAPSGHPYAMCLEGQFLYTTISVSDLTQKNSSYDGYGLANGFEIYNISDIRNPKLVSSTRIDGRFDAGAFDIYGLKVQGDYLYLSHTYNGIYVYDISDMNAPIRLCRISVPIYSYDEDEFRENSNNGKLWPFNRDYLMPDPILDFCLSDGMIYFAGAYTGIYAVEYSSAVYDTSSAPGSTYMLSKTSNNYFNISGAYSVEMNDSIDAHAVVEYADLYYVACGMDGIVILNQSLQEVSSIKVPGISKDVNVSKDGVLYVASDEGLYVYNIAATSAELLTSYECSISDLQISEDGTHIIAQGDKVYILGLQTDGKKYHINEIYRKTFSGLYYRNVMTGLVNGNLAAVQSAQDVQWWDLDDDSGDVLGYTASTKLGEAQGYAAYGDKCIAVYKNGYVVFDPTVGKADFSNLNVYRISENITGKAVVLADDILVVSKEYNGEVWILDISNVTNPKLIAKCTTNGSPDIAYGSEKCILIPNRHGGLIKLIKN